MEEWPPAGSDDFLARCDRCGSVVTRAFHRVHADDEGALDGCRYCLPRNVRWGEDTYDRSKDEAEERYTPPD